MRTTTIGGLTVWDLTTDNFDHTALAVNLDLIDSYWTGFNTTSKLVKKLHTSATVPGSATANEFVMLTANNGGYIANTLLRGDGSAWRPVGSMEIQATVPASGNWAGRVIILSAADSGFAAWQVIRFDGSAWGAVGNVATGSVGTGQLADLAVTTNKIANGAVADIKIADALRPSVSAGTTTEALRALGTTANTAAAGNDSRLSDTRTPTDNTVTAAKISTTLKPSSGATAGTEALRALGATSSTATAGDDARLSDTRTPTDASVTNAKVHPTAAIAWTKLATTGVIANADINAAAGIVGTKLANDTITPTQVSQTLLQGGTVTTVPASGTTVTFASAFPGTPHVTASKKSAWEANGVREAIITAISTTQFTIAHASGSNIDFEWIAVYNP